MTTFLQNASSGKLRSIFRGLSICTLTVIAAGFAQAQELPNLTHTERPLAIRLGGTFTSDSDIGHATTQSALGLDYALGKSGDSHSFLPTVYLEYRNGPQPGSTSDTNVYGLGLSSRTYVFGHRVLSPYVGLGLGAYYQRVSNGSFHHYGTEPGSKVFIGLSLTHTSFVEANYQYISRSILQHNSSFGIDFGQRF